MRLISHQRISPIKVHAPSVHLHFYMVSIAYRSISCYYAKFEALNASAIHLHKKAKRSRSLLSKFITNTCRAITVSLVFANLARICPRLYFRLPSPNYSSTALRSAASRLASRFRSALSSLDGRPNGGALNRI